MLKKINVLDCTLRDGGYYNNWNFSISLVNKYLDYMNKSNIKFIEIGFRSKILEKNIGLTGYSDDNFINKLKIPKNINLGVMINSSELISKEFKNKNLITKRPGTGISPLLCNKIIGKRSKRNIKADTQIQTKDF